VCINAFPQFRTRILIITDPDLIKAVLTAKPETFPKATK
jgi:hypothetical protein